jgi:hypothetical protein
MSDAYLKHLRKTVELNFPKDCYERYIHLVEPGIRKMIQEYLWPWQSVEMHVTVMVMRHKGVFKSDLDTIDLEPFEEVRMKNELDVGIQKNRKVVLWQEN